MDAKQAKHVSKLNAKNREKQRIKDEWENFLNLLKKQLFDEKSFDETIYIPEQDMTATLKKNLIKHGYKIHKVNPPEDPDDMQYICISWEHESVK